MQPTDINFEPNCPVDEKTIAKYMYFSLVSVYTTYKCEFEGKKNTTSLFLISLFPSYMSYQIPLSCLLSVIMLLFFAGKAQFCSQFVPKYCYPTCIITIRYVFVSLFSHYYIWHII
jgi:hypothetical protein